MFDVDWCFLYIQRKQYYKHDESHFSLLWYNFVKFQHNPCSWHYSMTSSEHWWKLYTVDSDSVLLEQFGSVDCLWNRCYKCYWKYLICCFFCSTCSVLRILHVTVSFITFALFCCISFYQKWFSLGVLFLGHIWSLGGFKIIIDCDIKSLMIVPTQFFFSTCLYIVKIPKFSLFTVFIYQDVSYCLIWRLEDM